MKKLSIACSVFSMMLYGDLVSRSGATPLPPAPADIDWASSFSVNSGAATDYSDSLGTPDAEFDTFGGGSTVSVDFGGFGSGDETSTTITALASLLGVAESVVSQADFIAFELNGGTGASFFETATFSFDDTVNTKSVTYSPAQGSSPTDTAIVAAGNITESSYETFFGISNGTQSVHYAFLLVDIDGTSLVDPYAAGFKVTMSSPSNSATASPDLEALGVLKVIPEPSAATLILAALTIGALGWRRRTIAK